MRSNWLTLCFKLWLLTLLLSGTAQAHKMRSVLLTVTEMPVAAGQTTQLVTLDLKSSLNKDGRPASVTTRITPNCTAQGSPLAERIDDAVLRRYTAACEGGLQGRQLTVNGLDPTTPDAFLEVRFASGETSRYGLSRGNSTIKLGAQNQTRLTPYFGIGVEHILRGLDHLLFVLGLLLLLRQTGAGSCTLVSTITAFTVAHSITLALAVLVGISLPSTPVEIVIALSILLLATEIYRYPQRQQQGLPLTLTAHKPWLVAFGFGLLHGFGFAGALAEIGVPQDAAVWALLLFNVGVEFGQLLFVGTVILLFAAIARVRNHEKYMTVIQTGLVHGIGGLAFFWVLQRGLSIA